jgi:transcriptional regulator with XRE-family HTH domain
MRLRQARIMSGLSLRDVAKEVGLSHQAIKKFEDGALPVTDERLSVFAALYNTTVEFILRKPVVVEFGKITFFKGRKRWTY